MYKIVFGFIVVLSLFLVLATQNGNAVAPKRNPLPSDYSTGLSWQDVQKNDKSIVICFYVNWCGACKRFAPIFEKYNKQYGSEYNFIMIKADNSKNEEMVKQFSIRSYPTVFLIDSKKEKKIRLKPEQFFVETEFAKELNYFLKT